ncbi:hypothetical protein AB0F92_22720 [Kitasatospora aureofaciens]|uniref:hypothetical protein n=1 Tax=Kitasatospora aureofaciens TaxID=1894 RepID=UPI00142DDD22|nr:hypothetical protein BOQ63_012425 [Streptomyces viridifaciens]
MAFYISANGQALETSGDERLLALEGFREVSEDEYYTALGSPTLAVSEVTQPEEPRTAR